LVCRPQGIAVAYKLYDYPLPYASGIEMLFTVS
jgi:hypothetical protein